LKPISGSRILKMLSMLFPFNGGRISTENNVFPTELWRWSITFILYFFLFFVQGFRSGGFKVQG
jgi:hypothetical protein